MKKSFGEYTRLAKGAFGCSSLWAGEEHLLYVKGTGMIWPVSETYRRIRYADITALTAAPSPGSIIWLSVSGALILILAIPLVTLANQIISSFPTADTATVLISITGSFALPCLIVFIYNLIRGRTCVYAIETSSGILKVRTANRLKVARRVSKELSLQIQSLKS